MKRPIPSQSLRISKIQKFTRLQISLFFWIFRFLGFFGFLGQKWAQKGPGGLPMGPGRHCASFGQSFSPNGPIWVPFGPLFVFQFPKNPFWAQIAPIPQSQTRFWGPGTQVGGSVRPLEAEGRLIGGPGVEPPGISPILAYFAQLGEGL